METVDAPRPAYWLPPITEEQRKPHGCLTCELNDAIQITFPPDGIIAIGFGMAEVTCDGRTVLDGEAAIDKGEEITGADAERAAAADPDHDWRIQIEGPLSGRTYQRQGANNWVLVEQNEGFA
jgi:hypothetical protein